MFKNQTRTETEKNNFGSEHDSRTNLILIIDGLIDENELCATL